MRKPRNKDINSNQSSNQSRTNQPNIEGSKNIDPSYVKEPHKWDNEHIKSFKDQAIDVLNYLDSIGEGIYDSDRYPGMYIPEYGDDTLPTYIKHQFNSDKNKINNDDNNDFSDSFLKDLFNKS